MCVPGGPELDREEGSPADNISQHDEHCHLQRLDSGSGHPGHTAGSGGQRETEPLLGLLVQVDLDGLADAHLAKNNRDDG